MQPHVENTIPQTQVMVPQVAGPKVWHNYLSGQAKVLGITQITIGAVCILLQCVALGVASEIGRIYIYTCLWGGVIFIIAGSFGLTSSRYKTTCHIVAFMVLSILSAVGAGLGFLYVYAGAIALAVIECSTPPSQNNFYFDMMCKNWETILALHALLLIICGLVELVVGIWSSAIGCRVVCCCRNQSEILIRNIETEQGDQGQVIVMRTQGQVVNPQGQVQVVPQQASHQVYVQGMPQMKSLEKPPEELGSMQTQDVAHTQGMSLSPSAPSYEPPPYMP